MFSNPFGSLFVKTEKPCYFAGETVNGVVYLQASQILQTNRIVIKIKGREHTRFITERQEYNQRTNRHDTITTTHHGQNLFYKHQFPLYTWGSSSVMPGQYQFPFSFILDAHLPGSFAFSEGQTLGLIRYKIKAELPSSVPIIFKPMKFSQELIVREPLKGGATNLTGDHRASINNCCISKGECHLKASFEKDHYLPGETAKMCYEIDNSQCKAVIENIVCNFNMVMTFHDSAGAQHTKNITVASRSLPGVQPGESHTGEARKYVELPLVQTGGMPIFPSTNGRLVKCVYNLSITACPAGCNCCATDPTVTAGVVVFAPPPAIFDTLKVPTGWNAQVMPVLNIVLSDSGRYQPSQTSTNSNYAPSPMNGGMGGGMGGGMSPGMVQPGGMMAPGGGMGAGPQQGGGFGGGFGGNQGGMGAGLQQPLLSGGGGMGPGMDQSPQSGGFGGNQGGMGGGMGPGMTQPGGMMSPGGGMGGGPQQMQAAGAQ